MSLLLNILVLLKRKGCVTEGSILLGGVAFRGMVTSIFILTIIPASCVKEINDYVVSKEKKLWRLFLKEETSSTSYL